MQDEKREEQDRTTSFADRVELFWQWFDENNGRLTELLQDEGATRKEEVLAFMKKGISILGDDVLFNIGKNELTFCVESNTECHYLYPYIVEKMPEKLKKQWKVNPCKQPDDCLGLSLRMYDKEIDIAKIKLSADYNQDSGMFDIRYYHPVLSEMTAGNSLNAFYTILELCIGEGAAFNYVGDVRQAKDDGNMYGIGELTSKMKTVLGKHDRTYSTEPSLPYCQYAGNPAEGEERLRYDIVCGSTQYFGLINEYLDNERHIYDRLASKGVKAAMLIISQPTGMSADSFLSFRYKIEDRLAGLFGKSTIKGRVLGGAYGATGVAYIDLLLYDSRRFMDFISDKSNLDALLTLDDGTVSPSGVAIQDFIQDDQARTMLRRPADSR